MVRFGAKEAGMIVYKNQWWRLLSSVMLHGGIFHMIPNGAIQVCSSIFCIDLFPPSTVGVAYFSPSIPIVAKGRRVLEYSLWHPEVVLYLLHLWNIRGNDEVCICVHLLSCISLYMGNCVYLYSQLPVLAGQRGRGQQRGAHGHAVLLGRVDHISLVGKSQSRSVVFA